MTTEQSNAFKKPMKLDHLAIAVEDLEAAISLYCEGLGLTLIERRTTEGQSTSMISAVLDGAGIPIILVQGCDPDSQVSRFVAAKGTGVQHVAFQVDEIDSGIAKLEELGVTCAIPVVEGDGIRQVFMTADNRTGARIELIERKGGNFNEASVRQLYLSFEERDLI
jgi:methylmalonyl-CoA/ethylmalonyl-CoA epimerase